jgi:2-polyprenyl-3-methyl-5-hydroxy-6-metoxy-1,4-benzoquinol methylase
MKPLQSPLISYESYASIEKIGSYPIHIQALKDLDRSLEEICRVYEPVNNTEEELLLDLCPYFGVIWPSARALSIYMSERKSQFSKKKGIEVGCGLGLSSIIAAKIGAEMIASDFHPDVGDWVKANAQLNQVRLAYAQWNWTELNSLPEQIKLGSYDFVLASDVLYESRHPEDLARALARLVNPKGSIYLSDPGRSYLDRALQTLEDLGFHRADFEFEVEESSTRAELRLEKKRKIQVFEFKQL